MLMTDRLAEEPVATPPPRPVRVIAVASGKGGVGKTNFSVNLAVALADSGKEVLLMDADLGLANVDVLLGLRPRLTLADVIDGRCGLQDILIAGPAGTHIVPAASGVQRMAGLSAAEHAGLIRAFSALTMDLDVLLVDGAAGIADSVVSFARAAQELVVVVCDEPASITAAHALITLLHREHGLRRFRLLANMVDGRRGREVYAKLAALSERLDVTLDLLGSIPRDERLRQAVQEQRAVVAAYPRAKASMAFRRIAERIEQWPVPNAAGGHLEFFVERLIGARGPGAEVLP